MSEWVRGYSLTHLLTYSLTGFTMAFHHLAGVTTLGAADEIVDWFATFEAWICDTVGWIRVSGSGTTDLVIRSVGEVGGLTMLYVRIFRGAGATINRVYFECREDAIGTHNTTNDGYVDSGGVQFNYWMSADLDAMSVFWNIGAGYRWKYAGLVMPFALTVPDETYSMISANRIRQNAAILRNQAGLWDQDAVLTDNPRLDDMRADRFDGSRTLCGVYHGTGVNIAGQLKHVSGEVDDPATNPEDTITSGLGAATTTWVILADDAVPPLKIAMRTGGVLPTGFADGASYASQTGVAATLANLLGVIFPAFLVGVGWTDLGDQGLPNCDFSRLFQSAGEDGNQDIFVGWGHQNAINTGMYGLLRDDAGGTHEVYQGRNNLIAADFPTNYWIAADRDCFVFTVQRGVTYDVFWVGMLQAYAPGLYPAGFTPYKVAMNLWAGPALQSKLLRDHDGAWGILGFAMGYTLAESVSNPNAYDGTTYLVWPCVTTRGVAGGDEPTGVAKYLFGTNGGGVASLDTITVGAQVYTVFFDSVGNPWAMRTT